jgi:hypothetical protein
MKRLSGVGSLIPDLEESEEDNPMNARDWETHTKSYRKGNS